MLCESEIEIEIAIAIAIGTQSPLADAVYPFFWCGYPS
jgi:hypothetical protein